MREEDAASRLEMAPEHEWPAPQVPPDPDDAGEAALDVPVALAADRRLEDLRATVARLAADPRLDQLTTVDRLGEDQRPEGRGPDRSDSDGRDRADVGERLAALEVATDRLAATARSMMERLEPLPERLGAMAAQVDRITPLAQAGDEADSMLARLDRACAGLEAVGGLTTGGSLPGRSFPDSDGDRVAADRRLEAVVDVLAGVTRRQDEVATAIGAVLNQVRGPTGVDAVLGRMEQRERSLASRLDRIDAELRRRVESTPTMPGGSDLGAVERFNSVVEGLVNVSRRQDELAAGIDRRLSAIEAGLQAMATGPRGTQGPSTSAEVAALRLAELRAERARVQAHLRDERILAAQATADEFPDVELSNDELFDDKLYDDKPFDDDA